MPFFFHTKNLKRKNYIKLFDRQLTICVGDEKAEQIKEEWDIHFYGTDQAEEAKEFFGHIEEETNLGMAWGITMPPTTDARGSMVLFLIDNSSTFMIRQNAPIMSHELGHLIGRVLWGDSRCTRMVSDGGAAPGSNGPCYVTKVHDLWYGDKKLRTYWIRFGFIWLPVKLLDLYNLFKNNE